MPLLQASLPVRCCRIFRSRIATAVALAALSVGAFAPPATASEAGVGVDSWKVVGRADLELGAHKGADGQFLICATDSQINFPSKAHPVRFDREVTVPAGQPYKVSDSYLGDAKENIVSAEKQPLIAYLLWRHLKEAGAQAEGGNPAALAGLVHAVHSSTNSKQYLKDKGELPGQVKKDAQRYLDEAAKYAGPYKFELTRKGASVGVRVVSSAGNPIGVKVQAGGEGKVAVGNSKAQARVSFTSAAKVTTLKAIPVAGKTTLLELKATGVPATSFRVWEDKKAQDMLLPGRDTTLTARIKIPAAPVSKPSPKPAQKPVPPKKTVPEPAPPAPQKQVEVPKEQPPAKAAVHVQEQPQATPPEEVEKDLPTKSEPIAEGAIKVSEEQPAETAPKRRQKEPATLAKTGVGTMLAGGGALALVGAGVVALGFRRRS